MSLFPDDEDLPVPPYVRGAPDTSKEAAHLKAATADQQRAYVFRVLDRRKGYGATLEELEGLTGLPGNSLRPRMWELRGKDRKNQRPTLVVDSGRRRRTLSGRNAVVWEVVRWSK
jgi:hypothetical protein